MSIIKSRTLVSLSVLTLTALNAAVEARAQQYVTYAPRAAVAPTTVQYRSYYQPPAQPQAAAPVQYQAAPAAAPATGDPYGFTNWLNGVRAQRGLAPVGYDPNLAAWANSNNAQQQARGIGHFVMGPARRQNSAMGHYASIGAMWMASPAHQAALLDPSIRMIGIAGLGAYWTYNAY